MVSHYGWEMVGKLLAPKFKEFVIWTIAEAVPRQITVGLRLRGVDVLTVQEDNCAGLADVDVLNRATQLKRVLFSRDDDLLAIAKDYQQSSLAFCGVIYSHQQNASIGACVQDQLKNKLEYLPLTTANDTLTENLPQSEGFQNDRRLARS